MLCSFCVLPAPLAGSSIPATVVLFAILVAAAHSPNASPANALVRLLFSAFLRLAKAVAHFASRVRGVIFTLDAGSAVVNIVGTAQDVCRAVGSVFRSVLTIGSVIDVASARADAVATAYPVLQQRGSVCGRLVRILLLSLLVADEVLSEMSDCLCRV